MPNMSMSVIYMTLWVVKVLGAGLRYREAVPGGRDRKTLFEGNMQSELGLCVKAAASCRPL